MMKHIFEQKVFYSDTDAYGVVWHGSYLRWLEMGRVGLFEMMGHKINDLIDQDITLPVVNLNVKYKSSARLEDEMIIEADVVVVAISNGGKLYRRMPEVLANSFNEVLKCPALV